MRYILALLGFLFLFGFYSQVYAQEVLQANINKEDSIEGANTNTAAKTTEVKSNNFNGFPLKDPHFIENSLAMKGIFRPKDRRIIYYDSWLGGYEVKIFKPGLFDKNFHYNSSGKLLSIGYEKWPKQAKTVQEFLNMEKSIIPAHPVKEYIIDVGETKANLHCIWVKRFEAKSYEEDGIYKRYFANGKVTDSKGNVLYTYSIYDPFQGYIIKASN